MIRNQLSERMLTAEARGWVHVFGTLSPDDAKRPDFVMYEIERRYPGGWAAYLTDDRNAHMSQIVG